MNIPKKIVNKIMKIYSLQKEVESWFRENESSTHVLWDDIEITDKPKGEDQGKDIWTIQYCNEWLSSKPTTGEMYIKISEDKYLKIFFYL